MRSRDRGARGHLVEHQAYEPELAHELQLVELEAHQLVLVELRLTTCLRRPRSRHTSAAKVPQMAGSI